MEANYLSRKKLYPFCKILGSTGFFTGLGRLSGRSLGRLPESPESGKKPGVEFGGDLSSVRQDDIPKKQV